MNKYLKLYNSLCSPAKVYLILGVISLISLIYQNLSNPRRYRVGNISVKLSHHNLLFFIFKIIYTIVWTFILNKLCKNGWSNVSWFLVLIPFILLFIIIGLFILANIARV